MKANIHPTYYENLKITCACGNIIIAGSTRKELKTELCSACHPFFTGKQKLIDTAGRVDKFLEKVKKMQEFKEKKVKVIKKEDFEEVMKEHETEEKVEKAPVKKNAPAKEEIPVKKEVQAKKAAKKTPARKKSPAKKTAKKK